MKKAVLFQALGLIAIVVIARLVFMSIPNFAPFIGFALFGTVFFKRKWLAFVMVALAFFMSDILVNNVVYSFYDTFTFGTINTVVSILAFGAIVLLGSLTIKRLNLFTGIVSALGSGIVFFLISNFGVWLFSGMYPLSGAGLLACYGAGIPFIHGTMFGALFFFGAFTGAYMLLKARFKQLVVAL